MWGEYPSQRFAGAQIAEGEDDDEELLQGQVGQEQNRHLGFLFGEKSRESLSIGKLESFNITNGKQPNHRPHPHGCPKSTTKAISGIKLDFTELMKSTL